MPTDKQPTVHAALLLWFARALATRVPVRLYMELGLGTGATFNQIAPLVSRAVGVDRVLAPEVLRAPNVTLYEMDVLEFVATWRASTPELVDLLFLDAGHEEATLLEQFPVVVPLIRPHRGIMVVDGTYPKHRGWQGRKTAWRAMEQIQCDPTYEDYEIVTMPSKYYGVSIVRHMPDKYLDWSPPHG